MSQYRARPAPSPANVSEIATLSRRDLVERWAEILGTLPPKGFSRRLLAYAVAYRLQAEAAGGLSSNTRRKLLQAAAERTNDGEALPRKAATTGYSPGTRLVREWHGRTYTVEVVENGFRCDGQTYRSLSHVARAITGTRWSGPRFFAA
jgi:hypothetical protein